MEIKGHKFLDDVSTDHCFWINDGPVVRNIYELLDALEHLAKPSFDYHVNGGKNDFADWIEKTLEEPELAEKIRGKSRHEAISLIREAIDGTEDKIEKEKIMNVIISGEPSEPQESHAEGQEHDSEEEESHAEEQDYHTEEEQYPTEEQQHHAEGQHRHAEKSRHSTSHETAEKEASKGESSLKSGFVRMLVRLRKSAVDHMEIFLLGFIIGIIIGKFVLLGN